MTGNDAAQPRRSAGSVPVVPRTAPRAYAVCACEPDTDFTFVLDLILNGAQKLKGTRKRQTQRDLLIPSVSFRP